MKRAIRRMISSGISFSRSLGRQKVFCVGQNKTGTTSLAKALKDLGFVVARQRPAEQLIHDWLRRDFRTIIRFCYSAQAFQDVPFSLPYTFQALDMHFPGSKFILTVRDSPEQWYQSMTRFHAKVFGNGRIPTYRDLKNASYCYSGWAYEVTCAVYELPDDEPYDKRTMIDHYLAHNRSVIEYFRHRPDDLLVINVANEDAYRRFCEFLEKPCLRNAFPWENRTAEIGLR